MNDFFCMFSTLGVTGRGAAHGRERQLSFAGALLAMLMLCVPKAQAQTAWKIVVPWRPPLVSVDVPVLFATQLTLELKQPVVVHEDVYDKHENALLWSLDAAQEKSTLVLFSEELTLFHDAARNSPRHLSRYEPLMLIWQSRWCLFAAADSPLQQPEALIAWMNDPAVPPMIGIPEQAGHMSIWVRGMERRTNRQWNTYVYGLKGSVLDALGHGAGVALSYCNRQRLHPSQTRILAQSGPLRSETMPDVPLFTEIGWAPMVKGWLAWMVPKTMPAAQREKMATALYRVMGKPAVQAQLRSTGHVVQHMSAAMSKQHIEDFAKTWRDIEALFSMGLEAAPAKPVASFEPAQRQY